MLFSDEEFMRQCGTTVSPDEFVKEWHRAVRHRFFYHPRNRKDFFLNLLTTARPHERIISEADAVLENMYNLLGSNSVTLAWPIPWQRDFKSGYEWPLQPSRGLNFVDAAPSADIKVPWELSRFHAIWRLGKAYWLTNREQYAEKFKLLVEDWIATNPPGRGVNWHNAMEPAIRVANWIAGYYFFCESQFIPSSFWMTFLKSLYQHGVFIEHHLEYSWRNHNHLLSDATGLIFLGLFFRHTAFGVRWMSAGKKILEEEMQNQVGTDGVDYEKSVSYHRFALELFYSSALLLRANNNPCSAAFMQRLERMFEFTLAYTRPDGSVPNVGDADDGRLFRLNDDLEFNNHLHALCVGAILFNRNDFKSAAQTFCEEALWLFGSEGFERWQLLRAEPAELKSCPFPPGGFYVMRSQRAHVFIDCGDLGQRGRGGHGHNDTFSFELWMDGTLLIVDSGTYAYTSDRTARQEFRSTRAHNTLMVDERELAEFSGLWEVRNDLTQPRVVRWESNTSENLLEADHRAFGPIVCRRAWKFKKAESLLTISDAVEGRGTHIVESFLHFHPEASLTLVGPRVLLLRRGNASVRLTASGGEWQIEDSWYSPSYGIRTRNKRWRMRSSVPLPFNVQLLCTNEPA